MEAAELKTNNERLILTDETDNGVWLKRTHHKPKVHNGERHTGGDGCGWVVDSTDRAPSLQGRVRGTY